MRSYYIDTNCLISFLTDRNPEQQRRITPFIEGAAVQDHSIIIIPHIIAECVYVLSSVYRIENTLISNMLCALVQTPGMHVETHFDITEIVTLWPGNFRDYGDAVLAASARKMNGTILTFDERFRQECNSFNIPATAP